MKPATYDITIYQGAKFDLNLVWRDVDLTSYTARMQIRLRKESEDILVSLTDGDGITLGSTAGTISIEISSEDTAALTFRSGVYDLELVSGGEVQRLLEGKVRVSAEVTR